MRKFFKFQVLKPLEVKTKFHTVSDSVYLEAQVQNSTTSVMSMVSVSLEPSMYFDVTDLNQRSGSTSCIDDNGVDDTDDDDDDDEIKLTFGCSSLNPLDTRQYLYKLIPKK